MPRSKHAHSSSRQGGYCPATAWFTVLPEIVGELGYEVLVTRIGSTKARERNYYLRRKKKSCG
jgi:hypothetical protein